MLNNFLEVALLVATVFSAVALLLFMYRNAWVCQKRLKLIDERLAEYPEFISYDAMLWRWWCWDIEAMKKPKKEEPAAAPDAVLPLPLQPVNPAVVELFDYIAGALSINLAAPTPQEVATLKLVEQYAQAVHWYTHATSLDFQRHHDSPLAARDRVLTLEDQLRQPPHKYAFAPPTSVTGVKMEDAHDCPNYAQ